MSRENEPKLDSPLEPATQTPTKPHREIDHRWSLKTRTIFEYCVIIVGAIVFAAALMCGVYAGPV